MCISAKRHRSDNPQNQAFLSRCTMSFTKVTGFLAVLLATSQVIPVDASTCFSGPTWQFDSNTYNDAWAVRSSLCNGVASCRSMSSGKFCEIQHNNLYAGFRANSVEEANLICWVSPSGVIFIEQRLVYGLLMISYYAGPFEQHHQGVHIRR